jgi:hypothetical protein
VIPFNIFSNSWLARYYLPLNLPLKTYNLKLKHDQRASKRVKKPH